jgi:hypothetical protein
VPVSFLSLDDVTASRLGLGNEPNCFQCLIDFLKISFIALSGCLPRRWKNLYMACMRIVLAPNALKGSLTAEISKYSCELNAG